MKIIFFCCAFFFSLTLSAQFGKVDTTASTIDSNKLKSDTLSQSARYKAEKDSADKEIIYEGAQHSAEYPGGGPAFNYFLEKNLIYPAEAKANNIQGKVYVTFVVDKKGVIKYPAISRSLGYGCDQEAMRLVKKMPKWKPGIWFDDQPVHTRVTMAIPFVIKK